MRGRIMEAVAACRMERAKLGQAQPGVSMGAIIDVAARRRSIWPIMSGFAKSFPLRSRDPPDHWNSQPMWKGGKWDGYRMGGKGGGGGENTIS